jgi:hypothetical protein
MPNSTQTCPAAGVSRPMLATLAGRVRHPMLATLAISALPLLTGAASAEVLGVGSSGFEVREKVHVGAAPAQVYAALLTPGRWWDSRHTYSGDASNITLEAKVGGCWCEKIPEGGAVEHMTVTYLLPDKALRLRGGLGPLQAMGLAGSLSVTLAAAGSGTDLVFNYAVGGYSKDGFDDLSKGVDAVLGGQALRLKHLIETGSVQSPAS